jgi:hypothetical protein
MKLLFLFLFFSVTLGNTQQLRTLKKLPDSLSEISGLTFLNDTTLVCHNDGGNEATLYFLNLSGDVVHQVEVVNAKNRDWESITSDEDYLYIADVGNNKNKRKNLAIFKVPKAEILKKETVNAEKIEISYFEQNAFPPADDQLYFDAEAMFFYQDSLHIFTKCRTKPFDGISYQYTVSTNPGVYVLKKRNSIFIGNRGFYRDAITDATMFEGIYWFLTYNRMVGYQIKDSKFEHFKTMHIRPYTQKEALVTKDNVHFYLADEKHKLLGGGRLYKLIINEK